MCQVISLKFPRYIVDLLIYIFRHYFIFGKFCQIRILIILIHWFILFQGLIIYVLDFFAYQVYQSFFLWSFFNVFLLSHFQYFLPSVFLFVNYILLIMLLQLFQFFPLWSPPPSTLHSLRQSPHHCSCPWVMCISSLVIPFPILSFTSPWLFCNYLFLLINPLTSSSILWHPLPIWQPSKCSPYPEFCLCSCLLRFFFFFLDSVVDRYVFIAILVLIVLIFFFLNKPL